MRPIDLNFLFTRRSILTVTDPAFESLHLNVMVLPARGFFGETEKPETEGDVMPPPGAGTFTVHVRVAGVGSSSCDRAATRNVCRPFDNPVKLRPPGHEVNAPPS